VIILRNPLIYHILQHNGLKEHVTLY